MWLSQIELLNYRNYGRLGLDLQPGVALFHGPNGQGKTNLLEAVHVLATTRSPRTSSDRELLAWPGGGDLSPSPPFARLEGRVRREGADTHLEVLFQASPKDGDEAPSGVTRTIKVNGLPSRAAGLVGRATVVYFGPEDVVLAGGPPAGRRKHLDVAISQVAPLYLRTLQQYNRILLQRNQVLRQVRERRQPARAVEPWTEQLVRTGVYLLRSRVQMIAAVDALAGPVFRDLSGSQQSLRLVYRPSIGEFDGSAAEREVADLYRVHQDGILNREVEQAQSLVGPHRDDFSFELDGIDLNVYGSRGQRRLAVLALKLAQAAWMHSETGETPIILLDDVLSELDADKRACVIARVAPAHPADGAQTSQIWLTATETDHLPGPFLEGSQRFRVDAGTVSPA